MSYNNFFHASDVGNLTELLPLSTAKLSDEKVCYFTPLRVYSLCYLRDKEINHVPCDVSDNGIVVCHEWFPDQLMKTYQGRSGYIYTCKNNDYIASTQKWYIWSATQSVAVASAEYIEDVYAEILKAENTGEAQIIRYESLSNETKHEIIVDIKNFIMQRGLLTSKTPQARFFAKNYPQSWEDASIENGE